jgi:hypothetical protein
MPRKEEAVKVEGFETKTGRYLLRQAYDHFYRQHWTLHPEMTVIHVYMRTFRWRTCSSKVHAQLRQIDPNIVRPFASLHVSSISANGHWRCLVSQTMTSDPAVHEYVSWWRKAKTEVTSMFRRDMLLFQSPPNYAVQTAEFQRMSIYC